MKFIEIYEQFKHIVFNVALQYVQNKEDAEEITQDVFVSIHNSITKFNQKSSLQTWIYRISINKSLDFIKAKKRQKRFAFIVSIFETDQNKKSIDPPNFDHPGVQTENREATERIFQLINLLPTQQKTALILSKIEGQTQKEISEIMNLSTKAVESLIQRAKTNLQKQLDLGEGKVK